MRALIAALGAICVLTTLTACSPGDPATSTPAARTAASATASATLAGTAAGTASAKPRNGLIAFMRPGTVGEYDIWVARPDDKSIELRQIKPGLINGDLVEVAGNLKPGEQIVTKGSLFIDRAAKGD